jgi:hypothetical protein
MEPARIARNHAEPAFQPCREAIGKCGTLPAGRCDPAKNGSAISGRAAAGVEIAAKPCGRRCRLMQPRELRPLPGGSYHGIVNRQNAQFRAFGAANLDRPAGPFLRQAALEKLRLFLREVDRATRIGELQAEIVEYDFLIAGEIEEETHRLSSLDIALVICTEGRLKGD